MLKFITDSSSCNTIIDALVEKDNNLNIDFKLLDTILNLLIEGFVLNKIIFDENNSPCDAIITMVNKSFENIMCIKNTDVIGKSLKNFLFDPLDPWLGIFTQVALQGETISFKIYSSKSKKFFKVNAFRPRYGELGIFLSPYIQDNKNINLITNIKSKKKKNWKFMAYHDPLTALPNRRFLVEKLNEELNLAKKCNYIFAIMFIDIDNFKNINDNLGHEVGDYVLKEFSFRLKNNIRRNDSVFRLGGDEFVIFLKISNGLQDVVQIAKRIIKGLQIPFIYKSLQLTITSSIGISIYPNDGNNVNSLLKHADIAMYNAKKECGTYFKFYNSTIWDEISISNNENRLTI
ncbi:diguanylate cyclase (GGDEF)-like protein [Clostridium tetanomorphum]|uniref:GGDEF domain-containing protein n=1 Tax=Clostridium tetanomorphum TaxID=1553 RepID=A0A923ED91_CLOTT|nr:GGDEF domain-containing protein [Clostridium tetanomorphum]KAJ50568.1 PAS/PAC sensor-containing diguanylate cyclase/phosphodiesterase [Clostridium tetanomorphum DSM 665]MBC2399029.1 GGDEF domain-containing protein [Clostridium tetanomorphum]MBP1862642.1 diguanylate cyclase (GGDEF)-like protein [Clostridium tetanomorphum]NRS85517.1 diguanylate cyclase (GGDEF)-like protein [Clostridium tetanomorphum]NRZ98631.1 diguanylate cyclase (GGDEF)-like protein [Clostridium tetanomorphum]